jgi:hypothetical protein
MDDKKVTADFVDAPDAVLALRQQLERQFGKAWRKHAADHIDKHGPDVSKMMSLGVVQNLQSLVELAEGGDDE